MHYHKPGTETGRLALGTEVNLSVRSTTHASSAGEVQWNVFAFVGTDLAESERMSALGGEADMLTSRSNVR